ncbi:hypothetical protein CTI14_63040, partial [Methylobacterium radiotolerans]
FVKDGDMWSSAGVTACIDLSLALVEADLGVEIAKTISRLMVVYHRRTGASRSSQRWRKWNLFVKDGDMWSSAGVTACIDLSLALVEADLGVEIA